MNNGSVLDRIGVAVSALCLAQCLLTPLLLVLVPALTGSLLFDGEFFHRLLVVVILPLSGVAFFIGCRQHRHLKVLIPAGLGIAAISVAAILGYARLGIIGEMAVTLTGAGLLAWAHLLNYRLCRRPGVCEDHGG